MDYRTVRQKRIVMFERHLQQMVHCRRRERKLDCCITFWEEPTDGLAGMRQDAAELVPCAAEAEASCGHRRMPRVRGGSSDRSHPASLTFRAFRISARTAGQLLGLPLQSRTLANHRRLTRCVQSEAQGGFTCLHPMLNILAAGRPAAASAV